ncbi:MAG: hypothetical protein PHH77_07465 [Victivallaceae bacterium]|nr:hypothetical protein [Victivallaceae bacterium]
MRKKNHERGAAVLESLLCILLLCLLFFGLMQIFQWSMAKMLAEYSSFYAAKAYSLGYAQSIVKRASRVAITGASGRDVSAIPTVAPFTRQKLSDAAEEYMSYAQYGPHGVNFEYWEPDNVTDKTPLVEINYAPAESTNVVYGRVRIKNMPLLSENLSLFLGGASEADIPFGEARAFNHAGLYLED